MSLSETRKGEAYAFTQALLWGLFPIVVILSFSTLPSLVSYAWSTAIAALFFAGVLTYRQKWHELLNRELWKYSVYILFFIGILFYGFYFVGLTYTTAGNAAIISQFEIFTSFVFFNMLRGEHLSRTHMVGSALMILGALIVLGRGFTGPTIGDLLIFAATCSAPIGNLYQQKARRIASSETIMFVRTLMATPIMFLLAHAIGMRASIGDVYASLFFLAVSGILVFGLQKMLWIETIHRLSVTKANALSAISPFAALFFAFLFLNQTPTAWQLLALVPFFLGTLLLTDQIGWMRKVWNAIRLER